MYCDNNNKHEPMKALSRRAALCKAPSCLLLVINFAMHDVQAKLTVDQSDDRHLRRGILMEEVIVRAQKKPEPIGRVPMSITAITGDAVINLGLMDMRDLGGLIPSFNVSDSGYSTPIYTLRGVGFNEASQTATATIGMYIDGQNLAYPVFTKGVNLDVERIEILKGPQGTLYGRNTTAGVVNYISKRPGEKFEAAYTAGYSNYETVDIEAYISGPMANKLGGRLAIRHVESGKGWQKSLTRPKDHLGRVDKSSARGSLVWQASESFENTFSVMTWTDRGEPQAPQVIALRLQNAVSSGLLSTGRAPQDWGLPRDVRNHPTVPRNTDDNNIADWTDLEWRLKETFLMLASHSQWAVSPSNTLTALLSYATFENDHSIIPQSGLSVRNAERELLVDTTAYALELRLDGVWGSNTDWMVGFFSTQDDVYEYQSVYIDQASSSFAPPDPTDLTGLGSVVGNRVDTFGQQRAATQAVFNNVYWRALDSVTITTGFRYNFEKRAFSGCTIDSPNNSTGVGYGNVLNLISISSGGSGGIRPGDCLTLGEEESDVPGAPNKKEPGLYSDVLREESFVWRITSGWQATEDDFLYATFSRGFKSGSFPVLASSSQDQYRPATQERLTAFEVGVKTDFFSRGLKINLASFYYDYMDKQLLGRTYDQVFGPLPILVNVPDSEVFGAEIEVSVKPVKGVFVGFSVSYLVTEVKEGVTLDRQGEQVDLAGNKFNFSPEIEVTAIADYVWAISDTLEMGVGADVNYSDQSNALITEEKLFAIDAYTLLNGRCHVGATDQHWKAVLWARNITDKVYTSGMFETGADTIARYVGMTRTLGISFNYKYE